MTTIIDGSAGITFPAGGNPQAAPSKLLQVVNTTYSTNSSTGSSSYVDTGLTATITPQFSTSKILILVNMAGVYNGNTAANSGGFCINRAGAVIHGWEQICAVSSATATSPNSAQPSTTYLDSPATTSATIYKVQARLNGTVSGNISWCNYNGGASGAGPSICTITLMEISV